MKDLIRKKIDSVIKKTFGVKVDGYDISIPEKEGFGDFSSSIAFVLAKKLNKNPREVAQKIVETQNFASLQEIEKVEMAGGGFINFFVSDKVYEKELNVILKEKSKYGSFFAKASKDGFSSKNRKVQVEFISANPTGPLTLGNGRGGFSGDTLSNVLKKNGYDVKKEYYINDAGNQVNRVLAKSIFRALGLDIEVEEGEDIYSGEYIDFVARKIKKAKKIDWIKENFDKVGGLGAKIILEEFIKKDIKFVGIKFDRWFSEQSLFKDKIISKMWKYLKDKNLVYENDGAYWLKTSDYGDEKDRVIRTSHGDFTYLMSDLAYAYERLNIRKFDKIIMFLGADHHGYVGRLMAIAEILGHKGKIEPIIFQLIRLIQDGKEVRMSKRKGTFIALRETAEDIGVEAARYFFISKNFNHHIDIDLSIAKAKSSQNPIYYIQYANARIASVLAKTKKQENKKTKNQENNFDKYEINLIKKLSQYPELIQEVGKSYEVHKLAFYAHELATDFHKFYDSCRIIDDPREEIRLKIIKASKVVLTDVLELMGIEPVVSM